MELETILQARSMPFITPNDAGSRKDAIRQVLLVEDEPQQAYHVMAALGAPLGRFRLEWRQSLHDAEASLCHRSPDIILLDLTLPDTFWAHALDRLVAAAPHAMIIGLSDPQDPPIQHGIMQRGMHDVFFKCRLDGYWLPRVLEAAVSSHQATLAAFRHDGPHHAGSVQTITAIAQQKTDDARLPDAEAALHAATEWARATLNAIGDAVLTTDRDSRVTYMNRAAETLTGWSAHEAIGKPLTQVFPLIDGQTLQAATNPARRAMEENHTVELAMGCVLIRQDGSQLEIEDSATPIRDRHGRVTGAVIVFHDACQSPIQSAKLAYQAQHDALTGLPNRVLLSERLSRAIGLAHRHQHQVALMYLDLDAFKPINDSLGHALGDRLLQAVAGRLSDCIRDTDTVCRQGGDEFVVLLSEIEKPQDAARIAEKILGALAEPYRIGNHELRVTSSIGISLYPDDGTNDHTLLHNADTAMYHSKKNGRNHYQFFRADMNALMAQRSHIETQLQRALKEDTICLDFQPKIDIATGALYGAEALIRWRDPTLGSMPPSAFLPVAEACGLIVPIGHRVLHATCRQLQAWREQGIDIVPVAVNVSALELRDRTLPARIADILAETGLEARFLELEVTESSLTHHTDTSVSTLLELSALGLRIAIDDFGAGSASLKHLKRFPIDTLNIAPCFIHDMADNPEDASFIKTIINLGQNLALRVTAKGVETQAQLDHLTSLGCDGAQGFLFSKPLPAVDFPRILRSARCA